MAPINADVAEVAAQLSAIRLRRNGLAAQRALAGALSAALVAAAPVVATALRGSITMFTTVATVAALATMSAIAYATWYARREWLSLSATARLADTHAHLDERLTTLLAVAPLAPAPALRCLLASQVVGARARWDLTALAPQRLSRWLALVPLALLVFGATAFYARPPAATAMRRQPASPLPFAAKSLAGAAVIDRSSTPDALADSDSRLVMASGARDGTERGTAARQAGGPNAAESAVATDGATTSGAADGGTGMGASGASDRLADLRQSIRDAFGAAPETDLAMSAGGGQKLDRRNSTSGDRGSGSGNSPSADQANGGNASSDRDKASDATAAGAQSATPGAATNTADGTRGSGRGGAGATGSQGVLGAAGSPQLATNAGAPMAIKLAAVSGVSPSQSEPQRRTAAGVTTRAATTNRETNLPDLANEQVADVTMQQLDVGPEHEAIVRRLFTRE